MSTPHTDAPITTGPKPVNAARAGAPSLLVAIAVGLIHAGFSYYWASDGHFLLSTVSGRGTSIFEGHEEWLYPIAFAKTIFALLPFLYLLMRRRLAKARIALALGGIALLLWGGINTVTANLNFFGVIDSGTDATRSELVEHAFVWDPLFFNRGNGSDCVHSLDAAIEKRMKAPPSRQRALVTLAA